MQGICHQIPDSSEVARQSELRPTGLLSCSTYCVMVEDHERGAVGARRCVRHWDAGVGWLVAHGHCQVLVQGLYFKLISPTFIRDARSC